MYTSTAPAPQSTILVLASGGLDSAVALALANLNKRDLLLSLHFNYGQRHFRELDAARRLDEFYEAVPILTDISDSMSSFKGLRVRDEIPRPETAFSNTLERVGILPATWKAARNLIMLSFAAAHAYHNDATIIAGGWHAEDYPGYPDCRPEFLIAAESAIQTSIASPVAIWAPLLHMNKIQIVKLGLDLDVPFEDTWSCYKGGDHPCHACDACIRREHAFYENGLEDPVQ